MLKDLTLLIPVKIDRPERLENLRLSLLYWAQLGVQQIIVFEQDTESRIPLSFFDPLPTKPTFGFVATSHADAFHKTYLNNLMIRNVQTQYAMLTDVDFLIPQNQLESALQLIRSGKLDFVTPFDEAVYETPHEVAKMNFSNLSGIDVERDCIRWPAYSTKSLTQWMSFWSELPFDIEEEYPVPCGGLFILNIQAWQVVGLDNQNIIGWAFDDHERIDRIQKLGFKWGRTGGRAYHLKHPRVGPQALFNKSNSFEWMKIKYMSAVETRDYVSSWRWAQNDLFQEPVDPLHAGRRTMPQEISK